MAKLKSSLLLLLSLALAFQPSTGYSAEQIAQSAPRIVGGAPTTISQAPWQVALINRFVGNDFQGQFCGGSIISPTWVLTAAHCLDGDISASSLMVLSGTNELSTRRLNGVSVKRIIIHPGWDPQSNENSYSNDIALVELQRPLSLRTGRVEAIALPSIQTPDNAEALVSGWGLTALDSYPQILQSATVETVSDEDCAEVYSSESLIADVDDHVPALMLCATGGDFEIDTCSGDSGGPLAINVAGRWEIHGITSFGVGCAESPFPGVYAEVYSYIGWISPYLLVQPRVRSASPTTAAIGEVITVSGSGFTGTSSVQLGSIEAAFEVLSDTQLSFTVPAGATTSQIRVSNPAYTFVFSRTIRVTAPPGAPEISTVAAPSRTRIGSSVRIRGSHLATTISVTVNGVSQTITRITDREVRFTVAAGSTSGPVVLTTTVGQTTSASILQIR